MVADAAWKLTASHNPQIASNALTINPWVSGQPQQAGMWFQIELPAAVDLAEIQFDAVPAPLEGRGAVPTVAGAPTRSVEGRGPAGAIVIKPAGPVGFAREYRVQTSLDGVNWSRPVAEGEGAPQTIVAFTPVRTRFVRITQTATVPDGPQWTIQKLRLFQASPSRQGRYGVVSPKRAR